MGTLTSYFSNEDSYGAWGFELEEKVKAGLVSNAANTSKGNISLCGERGSRQPPGIRVMGRRTVEERGHGRAGGTCLRGPWVSGPLHVCLRLKPRAADSPLC